MTDINVVFEAGAFCDVSIGRPGLGVKLVIEMTPDQAIKLRDELDRRIAELSAGQISLQDARELLPAARRGQVPKLWSAMVRSGVFRARCNECDPNPFYCPHYSAIRLNAGDVITRMDAFAAAVERGEVQNTGFATVTLGFRLVDALKQRPGD